MTFKKILGLVALACLTIIGLSACTTEKEPTWTYDKNKLLLLAKMLVYKFFLLRKSNRLKDKRLSVCTINLATQVKKP